MEGAADTTAPLPTAGDAAATEPPVSLKRAWDDKGPGEEEGSKWAAVALPGTGLDQLASAAADEFDRESLKKKSLGQLKDMCRAAGVPCSANKETLITYILNPAQNQKYHRMRGGAAAASGAGGGADASRSSGKRKGKALSHTDVIIKFAEVGLIGAGNCLKEGVRKGLINVLGEDGKVDPDKVICEVNCFECGESLKVTVRGAAEQADWGGVDYESGGMQGAGYCETCEQGVYITRMCEGRMDVDPGKFHNHCTDCPGFGMCLGDYRCDHCNICNKHYFAAGFNNDCCPNCADHHDYHHMASSGVLAALQFFRRGGYL